jgi:hypothetical protein
VIFLSCVTVGWYFLMFVRVPCVIGNFKSVIFFPPKQKQPPQSDVSSRWHAL